MEDIVLIRYISKIVFGGEVIPIEPKYLKPFVVKFTTTDNTNYTSSASYDEIMEAFETGVAIIGELYNRDGDLVNKTRDIKIGHYSPDTI